MKAILFGATGMIGQGVLRECLLDPAVDSVLCIGRRPLQDSQLQTKNTREHAADERRKKLRELVHQDLFHYSDIEPQLTGYDACFFCLGVSSSGMRAEEYEHITYDLTLAAAETLARLDPQMTFIYVSGTGTDSSEKGRVMWARVKGRTENALLRLPFKAAYMFRPGVIEPLHGIRSRTPAYRMMYMLMGPLIPLVRWLAPNSILTTEQLGRAMIVAAQSGAPKPILEVRDILALTR